MNVSSQEALIEEFPELELGEVVLQKEVYAHFGLLFFHFSLIEASIIDALTLNTLGTLFLKGDLRSSREWEQCFDKAQASAQEKTFGNLIKAIIAIQEFMPFKDELEGIKKIRDYFAHHFFREACGHYSTEDGCWHILRLIKPVREQLLNLNTKLLTATDLMQERLKLPSISDEKVFLEKDLLVKKAIQSREKKTPLWEKGLPS